MSFKDSSKEDLNSGQPCALLLIRVAPGGAFRGGSLSKKSTASQDAI